MCRCVAVIWESRGKAVASVQQPSVKNPCGGLGKAAKRTRLSVTGGGIHRGNAHLYRVTFSKNPQDLLAGTRHPTMGRRGASRHRAASMSPCRIGPDFGTDSASSFHRSLPSAATIAKSVSSCSYVSSESGPELQAFSVSLFIRSLVYVRSMHRETRREQPADHQHSFAPMHHRTTLQ